VSEPTEIPRINCQATVEKLADFTWEVTVWGLAPFDRTRIYTLAEKDDNSAAWEGIRRFTEEMEALHDMNTED
jgi:hypothetical protein